MNIEIKAIYQKYGDLVFSLAVPFLLECGRANFKRPMDIDTEAQNLGYLLDYAGNKDGREPLVSTELQVEIFRCAAELARADILDILKYIQTDMHFRGATIHPGGIAFFKDRQTGQIYSKLVLSTELSTSEKDRLSDKIRNKIAVSNRNPAMAIEESLDEMGISWDYIYSDEDIEF